MARIAAVSEASFPLMKVSPVSFSRISSGMPPMLAPMTGLPSAYASSTLTGAFSYHSDGNTIARAPRMISCNASPSR